MSTETIDYKQAFKYLRRDFFQMVVDDFDRFEEIHNINILERKHEIGNIKYLTLVKQKHIHSLYFCPIFALLFFKKKFFNN